MIGAWTTLLYCLRLVVSCAIERVEQVGFGSFYVVPFMAPVSWSIL